MQHTNPTTQEERFSALMIDPALDIFHPVLVQQLSFMTEHSHRHDDAHESYLAAIKDGETLGVIRSLEARVQYFDQLYDRAQAGVIKTAERLIKDAS